MEVNTSADNLKCTPCHMYIVDEMNATTASRNVFQAHLNALDNPNYAYPGMELNFSRRPPKFGDAKRNVCQLCHLAEQDSQAVDGTHTRLIVRACTDEDCHGNSTTEGVFSGTYATAGQVGLRLGNSTDVHSGWFKGMEQQSSIYQNEDGGNYSKGFYACLGCHTHIGVAFNVTRPNSFNVNLTAGVSGITVNDVWINESSTTTNVSAATPGSKWNN
jgi:hypothetical protein